MRAGRHAHERGEEAGLLIDQQHLLLDAGVARLLPRQVLRIDEARRERGRNVSGGHGLPLRVYGLRCSPTLTIFMVFVPPDLPIGSPMVRTMISPSFTTFCSTSTFSASCSSSSRSWPTYFTMIGKTSRKSAQRQRVDVCEVSA